MGGERGVRTCRHARRRRWTSNDCRGGIPRGLVGSTSSHLQEVHEEVVAPRGAPGGAHQHHRGRSGVGVFGVFWGGRVLPSLCLFSSSLQGEPGRKGRPGIPYRADVSCSTTRGKERERERWAGERERESGGGTGRVLLIVWGVRDGWCRSCCDLTSRRGATCLVCVCACVCLVAQAIGGCIFLSSYSPPAARGKAAAAQTPPRGAFWAPPHFSSSFVRSRACIRR